MMIRTAATVLALLCVVIAKADDPIADQFLAGHPSETAAPPAPAKPTLHFSTGLILLDRRPSLSPELTDKINSLFASPEREFPFSPRLIRQSNYDIRIEDTPLLSDEFRMMQERNAARRFHFFNGRSVSETTAGTLQPTESQAPGVDIILTAGDDSGLQPVIVAEGTPADTCARGVCAEDQPIDVLLADCDEDCEAITAEHACDDGCPEAATADAPELPPGLPADEVPPSLDQILSTLPAIVTPEQCPLHHANDSLLPEPARLDSGFRNLSPALRATAPVIRQLAPVPCAASEKLSAQSVQNNSEAASPPAAPPAETCSHAEPPLKAKVEHLLEAARHLAGAGYEEEAKLFRVEAEAIHRASNRLLAEKRQELERLQREIAELELLTGQYDLIQLDFSVLEFSLPADCDAQRCSALNRTGIHVLTSPGGSTTFPSFGVVSESDLVEFIRGLETCGCSKPVKIFAPKVVTTNGRTASISNGGSFVIPVASEARGDAKPEVSHESRRYGIELQALPVVLGHDRIRLNLVTEISEPDFSNAVDLNGTAVPGLTTRRCNTTVETQFGDIVAISFNPAKTSAVDQKCMLVLVTPKRVAPLDSAPAAE